ncbi:hypothetical protein MTO98_26685 [Mucilaginibacter sp. SMC90]|uniref:hypothetical protein n=1 Tax=Mucilaginibacter sp. SMC90 TaxID=2929803 RepID=UPI001FB276CA|nr:hypothetical protein [Mucilaginibacter sp. SMC90]UOE48002.1 hypothetical protein MTO98_26685 [Mucilaginibacter sp. SMC90]
MDHQIIKFDKPFVLYIKIEKHKGEEAKKLDGFLDENSFKYDCDGYNWFYHYHILCESLTDAAKIETFLQSPN